MLLSICMMVKNEEQRLDECLTGLKPILESLSSELIIVDTGSNDDTVEIAKRHTDRVYFHEWKNNFSEMRNITLSYATGKWVAYIDGDEVLQDAEPIIKFFKSGDYKKFKSAAIQIKNLTDAENISTGGDMEAPRFFIRKGFSFSGAVHNQPKIQYPCCSIPAQLLHYGYVQNDKALQERKFQRTATLLKQELEKNPEDIYYRFQLAKSYEMYGKQDKALREVTRAYDLIRKKNLNKKQYLAVFITALRSNLLNKHPAETERLCQEIYDIGSEYLDVVFFRATALFDLEEYEECLKYADRYFTLEAKKDQLLSSRDMTVTRYTTDLSAYELHRLCARAWVQLKDYDKALTSIRKAREESRKKEDGLIVLKCLLELEHYEELAEYYQSLILLRNKEELQNFEFYTEVELRKNCTLEQKIAIFEALSQVESSYGLLQAVRAASVKDDEYSQDLEEKIFALDCNSLKNYYADIFIYFLKHTRDISPWFAESDETPLRVMLAWISRAYIETPKQEKVEPLWSKDQVIDWLWIYANGMTHEDDNLDAWRIRKNLFKCLLTSDDFSDEIYLEVFEKYIECGVQYLIALYNPRVIEEEKVFHLYSKEDIFFTAIYHAWKALPDDPARYVKYLNNALQVIPLTRGIELLLKEMQKVHSSVEDEAAQLQQQLKDKIKELIEQGNTLEAEALIAEYEEVVEGDMEILFFKSQLRLLEGPSSSETMQ